MPYIRGVGSEDTEELLQDALTVAAKMLHDLEERGKTVTPGNVAYYTILHMKSGRRSYSAGRTDVMNAGTQLDSNAMVLSFEEPAGYDPDTDEEIPLGDMLAGSEDDPAMSASRAVDWEEFLEAHDERYGNIVCDLVAGKNSKEASIQRCEPYSRIRQLKENLAEDLREYFGADAIADSVQVPSWRGNIHADKERFACRADRRRW